MAAADPQISSCRPRPALAVGAEHDVAAGPAHALAFPSVPPLLLVCLAFMAAFYGTDAFVGDAVRQATGASAGTTGVIVLSYGIGFGAANLADRRIDRLGAETVLPWALAAVAGIYLTSGQRDDAPLLSQGCR